MKITEAKVSQYAEEMRDGARFPPPIVYIEPATELYWVADGFHRVLARKLNGDTEITVDVRRGSYAEAVLCGININRQQRGLPLSSGDIRRCIKLMLREYPDMGQAAIAEQVGCSAQTVSRVARGGRDVPTNRPTQEKFIARKEACVALLKDGATHAAVAKQLALSRETVTRYARQANIGYVTCPTCHGRGIIPTSEDPTMKVKCVPMSEAMRFTNGLTIQREVLFQILDGDVGAVGIEFTSGHFVFVSNATPHLPPLFHVSVEGTLDEFIAEMRGRLIDEDGMPLSNNKEISENG